MSEPSMTNEQVVHARITRTACEECLDSGIRAAMCVVRDTELCARRARHRSFRPCIPPVSLTVIGVSLTVIS